MFPSLRFPHFNVSSELFFVGALHFFYEYVFLFPFYHLSVILYIFLRSHLSRCFCTKNSKMLMCPSRGNLFRFHSVDQRETWEEETRTESSLKQALMCSTHIAHLMYSTFVCTCVCFTSSFFQISICAVFSLSQCVCG